MVDGCNFPLHVFRYRLTEYHLKNHHGNYVVFKVMMAFHLIYFMFTGYRVPKHKYMSHSNVIRLCFSTFNRNASAPVNFNHVECNTTEITDDIKKIYMRYVFTYTVYIKRDMVS